MERKEWLISPLLESFVLFVSAGTEIRGEVCEILFVHRVDGSNGHHGHHGHLGGFNLFS